MQEKSNIERMSESFKHQKFEGAGDSSGFWVGIDVGSTSSDIAVLNERNEIVYSDYRRTKGKPIETLNHQLKILQNNFNAAKMKMSATGSVGRFVAEILGIPFINEVPAQARAIGHLYPQFEQASVIEMGGQDTKLIFLARHDNQVRVRDFALNTVCAAGTGSFLDQQAERLGINIEEEFGQLALQSKSVPRMAGRCSVFAKSDMIHLQQQATPVHDILAGLCLALARNLKSNLGSGRQFVKPIVFTGGVAANIGVVRALEEVFELEQGGLAVPKEHFFTGAIGAVLAAKTTASKQLLDFTKLDDYLNKQGSSLKNAPRLESLKKPTLPPPESKVYDELLEKTDNPIDAYLGVDVGSISTNVVVMDTDKRVLAKAYLMTAGRPLEAVKQGLEMVAKTVLGKVNILGAATTGSGRYLTGDFIGADTVINEITAQAAGAAIVNPKVDTIFEIGGQDSKYISLENGVVVDFEMNHACAAGTGSFLEEQAQRLGISINNEFAELAFKSKEPIKLGERCTVFMESDLLSYQQQGAATPDLVAGLSYSIVTNYLNRVVGRRKIGNNICFQGGTAFNKAVWAAFERITGKPIMVPDHHEVTGAIGAASIAAEHMKKTAAEQGNKITSRFRGFENLVHISYSVESFSCEHCSNTCEIKKVQLPNCEPLYYGSRCDRYNLKKKTKTVKAGEAFQYRNQQMLECAGLIEKEESSNSIAVTIGIPRALVSWQLLPLFRVFLKEMGFNVLLSPLSDKRIIRRGVESVTAQTCYPVKVAYGHVEELLDRQPDYIFIPSIVSMTAGFPQNKHNQLCPYVQTLGYQVKSAFADRLGKTKIITTPMRLGDGPKLALKSFEAVAKDLGVSAKLARIPLERALKAQCKFEDSLREEGRSIINNLPADKKLFVLVSRSYNGCDEQVNLQLPKKLAEMGVEVIPMEMLDLSKARLSDEKLHSEIYWASGQKILRAAEIIKQDPRLFAIYLSNFSCGPDSFLLTFFKDIMGDKPCLQLELDEHSADAGVITRLEAFFESLKHYDSKKQEPARRVTWRRSIEKKRTLYIPYMGDCAYAIAACFRSYGQPSQVMPMADEDALMKGRRFTTGKECLPCTLTTGDMLKTIETNGSDKVSFFMPSGSGPCRFGMYNCMQRLILRASGKDDVPVISPNQDDRFYAEFIQSMNGSGKWTFMRDIWIASVGVDNLFKLLLRIRPYAKNRLAAQQVYDRSLKRYIKAVEDRLPFKSKVALMASIAEDFAEVKIDHSIYKPKIGIVGEIYVRSHPFANSNIIERLEALGAACELAPLAEWIYYTNITRRRLAGRRGQIKTWFSNLTQNFFQQRFEKSLAKPLEEKFGPLIETPLEHVFKLARPYIHDSFEGEAVLSVGKMVEYHHKDCGGVINVMPFSCMPSTIVSTQTRQISKDCSDMPILNISFDGQEDPSMTTRLEAFVEQVRQRKTSSIRELVNV